MVSRTGTFVSLAPTSSAELAITLSRYLVRVTLGLFLLLFLVLLTRQRAGMLTQPVPAGGLVALGGLLAVLFAWFHGTHWQRFANHRINPAGYLEWLLPLLLTTLVTLSVGRVPGSSQTALLAMWGFLGTSEVTWILALLITRRGQRSPGRTSSPAIPPQPVVPDSVEPGVAESFMDTPTGALTQQMTRSLQEDGSELIFAATQADFETGQRTQTVHLAFCPPLQQPPSMKCNQLDGPACRIKIAESQIYGARFEIRLQDRCPQPVQVRFQVEARSNPADS
ncbi:MAG: hypothetical protein OSB47_04530 [Pirellulaceae bacterium]|nr:hypothetical protein [Pirellulaceae bacterium]